MGDNEGHEPDADRIAGRAILALLATVLAAITTAANALDLAPGELELAIGFGLVVVVSALAALPSWQISIPPAAVPRLGFALLAVACVAAVLQRHLVVASRGVAPDEVVALVAAVSLTALAVRGRLTARTQAVALALAVLILLATGSAMVLATSYHSDAVAGAHHAALLTLRGEHPYAAFDMLDALARAGLSPEMASHQEDGTVLRTYNYPALSFLIPLPFIVAGLADLRWLYLAEIAFLAALLARATLPQWRPAVLAAVVGTPALLRQNVAAGLDPAWAVLTLLAWRYRHTATAGAVLLGLAAAVRQPAWFFVPFFVAAAWREHGAARAVRLLAIVAATALAPNLPFLLTEPAAFVRGVLDPGLAPLQAHGVGLVLFAREGLLPAASRGVHAALVIAAFGALLALVWGGWPRLRAGALVFPLLPLYVAWRSLQSYFSFLPVFALVAAVEAPLGPTPPRSHAASRIIARVPVDPELLEILACPDDKAPVREEGDRLVCTQCGRRYPVRDDIPVMLLDEAEPPRR